MTEPAPLEIASADPLIAGREALGRHAWQEAFDFFLRADEDGTLTGSDLETFAEAAFFAGRASTRRRLRRDFGRSWLPSDSR